MNLDTFLDAFGHVADAPGGIDKLRSLILDLAVRGRLVSQNPADEPASVLLERIHVECERMVAEKEIKKPKALPAIDPDDVPYELPERWEWARLGELGRIVGGATPDSGDPSNFEVPGIPWLTPADLSGNRGKYVAKGKRGLTEQGYASCSAALLPKGSVVFSSRAPIGYVAITTTELCTNQGFKSIAPFDKSMSGYLYWVLRALGPSIQEMGSGTTFMEVSGQVVAKVMLPVAPAAEQQRIVAKVDELMGLCDELEASQGHRERARVDFGVSALRHLAHAPKAELDQFWRMFYNNIDVHLGPGPGDIEVVKELRRTILDLAVRGRLVSQDPADEPASVLLARIRAERERMAAAREIKKPKALPAIDPGEVPYELPEGWEWVRLGALIRLVRGITFPASDKQTTPAPGHIACLRTTNVQKVVEWGDLLYVPLAYVKRTDQLVRDGDLMISMANSRELVGKLAPVLTIPREATFGGFIAAVRADGAIPPAWVLAVMRSSRLQELFRGGANQTTNIANISVSALSDAVVGLPPGAEQQRIVAKVDALLGLCDELEQQFCAAEERLSTIARIPQMRSRKFPTLIGVVEPGAQRGEPGAMSAHAVTVTVDL